MLSTDKNDWWLLREYVERGSEAAFETLARRHLDMVYSAAWRQTSDRDLAEEATQAVFVLLARKARGLRQQVVVAGWLYRAACLTARRALRDQTRRRVKEREVAEMKLSDSDDKVWNRLMPHLDAALANLGEADRTAIILRFLEGRNFRDVAGALRINEDAAKKRVARALEKLRLGFARKGVTLGAGVVAALLSERAMEAAPARLLGLSVKAGISGGTVAGTGVVALTAGVLREVLIARLRIFAVGVATVLVLAGLVVWGGKKNFGKSSITGADAREAGVAAAGKPPRPLSQEASPASRAVEGRTMILHVMADENDEPLANATVHVQYIIMPNAVPAKFVTDKTGAARIVRPAEPIDGMSYWVFVPGRVPTTVFWDTKESVASLVPEYTLRLPLGRLVAGTVVDEAGKPVAGATVHFEGEGRGGATREFASYEGLPTLTASEHPPLPVTDTNGRWSVDYIWAQTKNLYGYVEHPEYAVTQFGRSEPPGPVEPSTNVVLQLERGGAVTGTVRDAAGAPVAGANVNFGDLSRQAWWWTNAGADGRFEFPRIGSGDYCVSVNAPGFRNSEEVEINGGQATNVEIVLKPEAVAGNAVIRGAVIDENGKPIGGTEVVLANGQAGLEDIYWGVQTGADGRFVWNSAPNHPVKLVIGDGVRNWEQQQVELAPDGTEAVITLKKKAKVRLHGTVRDKASGNLVPEYNVLFAPGIAFGYVGDPSILAEGRDGKFTVEVVSKMVRAFKGRGSASRVDFRAKGYQNKIVELAEGTNDIEINVELEPATFVAGRVLKPDGQPAEGAKVFFRGEHFQYQIGDGGMAMLPIFPRNPVVIETDAGADGGFKIEKIDGAERLEVVHPDGWAFVPLDGKSTSLIHLRPWGKIHGVVKSAQGVLAGVAVQANQAMRGKGQVLFVLSAQTDADGQFEFSKVPEGGASVFLDLPPDASGKYNDNGKHEEVQVEAGQTTEVTLSVSDK